jgi:subtilisin family serine protease
MPGEFDPTLCDDPEAAVAAYRLIHAQEAWALVDGRELDRVRVAVLDDGVDIGHHDLAPAVVDRFDCFNNLASFPLSHDSHGTGCAGLAVARPQNQGMKGVGFGAELLAIRVNHRLNASGDIITSGLRIKRGIEAAVAGKADVISMSWSAEPKPSVRAALEAAAKTGRDNRGCVCVAAAGNDGGVVRFPALLDCVIAVTGCDENGKLIRGGPFASNYGPEVDITAPAVPMFTTALGDDYTGSFQGSSAATALVAGASALMLQVNPELKAKEVRDLLINTARPVRDVVDGRTVVLKVLDVRAAILAAMP